MRNTRQVIVITAPKHMFDRGEAIRPAPAISCSAVGKIDRNARGCRAIAVFQVIATKAAINAVIAGKAIEAVGNIIAKQRIGKIGRRYTFNPNQRVLAAPAIRRALR